jgi:hypothetical protein
MRDSLTPQEARLLREVVTTRAPALMPLLQRLGIIPLTGEQRESLRSVIAEELTASGLRADSEPNSKGLDLERLIDLLGHY